MIEFGTGLRNAREAKGYTIGQIAEMTHISPTTINDLENEDFSHLAAPIYGRGFVKLYCEAVGIEAKPYVDEFMSIYNGERDIPIKERAPVSSEPPSTSQPPPIAPAESPETPPQEIAPQEDLNTPQKPAESDSLFSTETSTPFPTEQHQSPPSYQDESIKLAQPPPIAEERPSLSRYASPLNNNFPSRNSFMSPSLWRIATLCIASLLVLWLIVMGIRALYRATSTPTEDEIEQTSDEDIVVEETPHPESSKPVTNPAPTSKATPAAKPASQKNSAVQKATPPKKKDRQVQAIPPLYVD